MQHPAPRTITPAAIATTLALACGWCVGSARGQLLDASAVTAEIRLQQSVVMAGQPVWADFTLHNPTDQVAILHVPGASELDLNPPEMGLPVAHVYGDRAEPLWLSLRTAQGESHIAGPPDPHRGASIALRLAPQGSVGVRLDLAQAFPVLRQAGIYDFAWAPYAASVGTATARLEVRSFKQARIETDYGAMTVRLFYDRAPQHVENFIDLAGGRFYDNLTFHRVAPGYLIQGGSPDGQPAGRHPDGRLLSPELSDYPFGPGTVGMARSPADPNSASCQFFICATRIPELDGQYTAFGQLVGSESFATLEALLAREVDDHSRPLRQIYIRRIRLQDAPPEPVD